ncbi:dickkopf-related protein 4 [Lepisosteus oculatus]|uniref:dickkopf-related protein 4 n=1 Tax=Lepisosteus oculatus TaxID=7918 RepID=UPI0007401B6B|nr:PREDICTED: dickkopf-related protein 4 [Lepisosteus oculatus]
MLYRNMCWRGVAALSVLCCVARCLILESNTIKSSAEQGNRNGQALRCQADSNCTRGQYCDHSRPLEPVCAACRPARRRCHSDSMCCSGMLCINEVCGRPEEGRVAPVTPVTGKTSPVRGKSNQRPPVDRPGKEDEKGQQGAPCVRSSDCGEGLCCARHLWVKICKRRPGEGELCSKRGRKEKPSSRETYQRCDCNQGLVCRPQAQTPNAQRGQSRLSVCQRTQGPTRPKTGPQRKARHSHRAGRGREGVLEERSGEWEG